MGVAGYMRTPTHARVYSRSLSSPCTRIIKASTYVSRCLEPTAPTSLHYLQVLSSLDTGVAYYVRVSARNSLGYGATQSSSPTYQHPYEEPTAPSDVVLGTTSDTMLTVSYSCEDYWLRMYLLRPSLGGLFMVVSLVRCYIILATPRPAKRYPGAPTTLVPQVHGFPKAQAE